MLAAQTIYGPDDRRQWTDDREFAMGRGLARRLPEDRYDTGVVLLEDGQRLVADARLDNRPELEDELAASIGDARRASDAAILGAAWSRWGEGCFDRLLGDYAFAVWHPGERRLVLARDPFGRRPLHYFRSRRLVAFATMPMGLHALAEIPAIPDLGGLAASLALRPETGSTTFFRDVERVEPGSLVVAHPDQIVSRRHYVPRVPPPTPGGAQAVAEALREQLDRAVAARLRGTEGRTGAQLSSGWDSAAVATTAARLLASSGERLTAFTACPRPGYAGAAPARRHADESAGAAAVAAMHPNIDHVLVAGAGRSPLEDLDRDQALNGRPSLNPCNHLWFNDINRAARSQGVQVLLTGDFGNLGLTDDGLDSLAELALTGRWLSWWRLATAAVANGDMRWRGVLAASFEWRAPAGLTRSLRRVLGAAPSRAGRHSALRPEVWARLSPRAALERPADRASRVVAALTRLELSGFAKGALAAYGVDLRDPLTDRRLLEFCFSIPSEHLAVDGRPRGLARRVLADRLPASVLNARTRGYQGADWHEGLTADRAGVARDLERFAAVPAAADILDLDRLRTLLRRWPEGGWESEAVLDDYRAALLRGVAVGRFLTRTLGVNG
jgi:asparagine synthase (glutamine-hydrolysing)